MRVPANAVLNGEVILGDIVTGRLMHTSLAELIAADDGDPSTTAMIHDLEVWHLGEATTLLEIVREASGKPDKARVDLRLHSDLSSQIWITTKQDGWLRKLNAVEIVVSVPALAPLGLVALGAGLVAISFRMFRRAA